MGDLADGVLGVHDLALLGHLEPAGHGPGWKGEDRTRRRPSAAADRAAASMEEDPVEAVAAKHLGEPDRGPGGGPRRGDVADILVRVRVADHHLLLVPDG